MQVRNEPKMNVARFLKLALYGCLAWVMVCAGMCVAQAGLPEAGTAAVVAAELPEDPSALLNLTSRSAVGDETPVRRTKSRQEIKAEREASLHMKHIPPGWRVSPLTREDKVLLGVDDLVNPLTLSTEVISAGYSHLRNSEPNYGTNSGAFAQRVGATLLRDSSQGLFTDAVFAPLLHEDPRYYRLGRTHGFWARTMYAVTRPLVTRDDGGRATANSALLLGYASAAGLTYAYYPQSNRNAHDVAATFGGSIGGAAFGDFVDEFVPEILGALHGNHQE